MSCLDFETTGGALREPCFTTDTSLRPQLEEEEVILLSPMFQAVALLYDNGCVI